MVDIKIEKDEFGSHQEEATLAPEAPSAPVMPMAPPPSSPENFDDVKSFGNRMSYGIAAGGGNPPFSIIIKDLKYKEDAEDILSILRSHGLLNEENEELRVNIASILL